VLREKWPLAFPVKDRAVRPLAIGTAREITATMGWPLSYTLGVLVCWKMAALYCQDVLCYEQRIALEVREGREPAVAADMRSVLSGHVEFILRPSVK